MDVISVPLAVIAFTTAVKDLVELGQRIHESFAKVSKNYQKARSVAEDIKEMVDEIKDFCEEHQEALENMKDFRLALDGLLARFKKFEASILPLLPKTGGRKRDRFTRAWDAWRNNNKIQDAILDLQSATVKVVRRYMVKSAMRAEVELGKIHQETTQGLTGISQGLEVLEAVRRDVSVIRVTTEVNMNPAPHSLVQSSATPGNDIDRQIVMFAQSTSSSSVPMLRTPNVITEELMTAAYIKLQIGHIAATLENISKLPVATPADVDDFHMRPSVIFSKKITDLQHYAVRNVLDIRDHLNDGSTQTISIQKGARVLSNLSHALEALNMGTESIQLATWATKLSRTLIGAGAEDPNLSAALSFYLTNQSQRHHKNGNKTEGLQAAKEAYTIALNLRNQFHTNVDFQILYSHVLLCDSTLGGAPRSAEMFSEVLKVLDDSLNIQGFTMSEQMPEQLVGILRSIPSFFDRLFRSDMPIFAILNHVIALEGLGACFLEDGRWEVGTGLQVLAIAIRRKFVDTHGDKHKVYLAEALLLLAKNQKAKDILPVEELIHLTNEGVQLFRELADYNPVLYSQQLIDMLWAKATTLGILERDTEAIATWEQIISLAEQVVEDSKIRAGALCMLADRFRRLKRHNDAVQTATLAAAAHRHDPDTQSTMYGILSHHLCQLQRYRESAEAARTAVALYRCVVMKNPGASSMGSLTTMISHLAHCLAASGASFEALIAWREAVGMLDNILPANAGVLFTAKDGYSSCLRAHITISYVVDDAEGRLKVSSTAAQYLRKLLEIHPHDIRVIAIVMWAEHSHGYNTLSVGRLQEAHQYMEDWVDQWKGKLEATQNPEILRWHAAMIGLKSSVLDAQGRTEEALLADRRICNIVKPSINNHHLCFLEMIKSMFRGARLQSDLGNDEEALRVADEALQLARDNNLGRSDYHLVQALQAFAATALICGKYERAVEVALEGSKICGRQHWQDNERESSVLFRPSLLAILSSAEANLGRYSTAEEYAKKSVEVSLEMKKNRFFISTTTAEQSYMETHGNLAEVILVSDLAQVRQICEERRAYFSKRVDERMGEYRDLAPILRMLGVLCCNNGQHEEGSDAAQELLKIMKTLGTAFPSLQQQVKIRLRRLAKAPVLQILTDMIEKLDCEHQAGVVSLLAD